MVDASLLLTLRYTLKRIAVSLSGDAPIPGILFYWTIRERNTSRVPDRAAYSRTTYPFNSLLKKSPSNDLTKE